MTAPPPQSTSLIFPITLPNLDRFSKLFHCSIQYWFHHQKIILLLSTNYWCNLYALWNDSRWKQQFPLSLAGNDKFGNWENVTSSSATRFRWHMSTRLPGHRTIEMKRRSCVEYNENINVKSGGSQSTDRHRLRRQQICRLVKDALLQTGLHLNQHTVMVWS